MGTGRNWTRKSIEELVDQYIQKHGGSSPVDPAVLNAKLVSPNSNLYGYVGVKSIPSGYSAGVMPSNNHPLYYINAHLVEQDGVTRHDVRIIIEEYSYFTLRNTPDADFANQLYPRRYRTGYQITNQGLPNTEHNVIIVGTNNKALRCDGDSYVGWLESYLGDATIGSNLLTSIKGLAPNNVKLKALKDAINAKHSDITTELVNGETVVLISSSEATPLSDDMIIELINENLSPLSISDMIPFNL